MSPNLSTAEQIVGSLAELDPRSIRDLSDSCMFCFKWIGYEDDPDGLTIKEHKPYCLWRRAVEYMAQKEANDGTRT